MADDFTRELSDLLPAYAAGMEPLPAPSITGGQIIGPSPAAPLPPMVPPGAAMQQSVAAMGSMAPPELAAAAHQAMQVHQQQQAILPNVSPNFNPMLAGYMDPTMNMPGAGMMTHANYGVFRQQAVPQHNTVTGVGAMGGGSVVPEAIVPFLPYGATDALGFPTLERTRPDLQFRRGFDSQLDLASEYSRVIQGRQADFIRDSGAMIAGMGGALIGNVGGSIIGGALGGVGGSIAGGTIGSVVGGMAGFIPGVSEVTAAAFRPAIERRADAIQAQFASRNFLVGGRDLDISGTGLSTMASQRMMGQFDDIARGSKGQFNRQDVMQLMQVSGEQGLLDFAQNADQIASTVKQVTTLVATMGQITGDPDFRENLKKIGNLRRLGFSMGEMDMALKNADSFSRMAGTDINTAMQTSGLQGAQIFQAQGMDAATGMQTGMFSAGSANLAIQSGAFDEQTLALYGGKSGVAQQLTELSASFAAGPMSRGMLPYAMKRGKDGALTVDTEALDRLRTGEITYAEAVRQGASKFSGDKAAILEMSNRQRELTAQATRAMGPEGLQQMFLTQGDIIGKDLGGGLTEGLQAMGMNRDQANILTRMAKSGYLDNLRQQQQAEARRRGFEAAQTQDAADLAGGTGILGNIGLMADDALFGGGIGRTSRRMSSALSPYMSPLDSLQRGVSRRMAMAEEDTRLAAVGARRFRGGNMILTDKMLEGLDESALVTGGRSVRIGDGIGEDTFGLGGQAELERLTLNEGYVNRTLRGTLENSALLAAELTGDSFGVSAIHSNAAERRKSASQIAASYTAAGRTSTAGRARASSAVTDTLMGGRTNKAERAKKYSSVRKVSQGLAALAKKKTSVFGTADAITTSELRDILQSSGMDKADIEAIMSDPKAQGQLIASSLNDMDDNTRAQVVNLIKDIDTTQQARAGEDYLSTAERSTEKAFAALNESGFATTLGFNASSMSDLSEGEQDALRRMGEMGSDEDVSALALASLAARGEGSELLESEGISGNEELQKRLAKQRTLYNRLTDPEKRAIDTAADNLTKGAKGMGDINKKSKRLRGAVRGIAVSETMSQFRGALDKRGISLSDTSDVKQMMKEINTLSASEREKVGADVIAAAEQGNTKAFLKAMSRVEGVGDEGLTVQGRSVSDASTAQQEKLVRATGELAARFTVSTDANTTAINKLTSELKKRTPGEGALFQRTSIESR